MVTSDSSIEQTSVLPSTTAQPSGGIYLSFKTLKNLSEGLAPRVLRNKQHCGFLDEDLQSTWDKDLSLCTAQWLGIVRMQREHMLTFNKKTTGVS